MAAEEVQGDPSTEVFSPYAVQHPLLFKAKPHPADIVEAASLAVSDQVYCVYVCHCNITVGSLFRA